MEYLGEISALLSSATWAACNFAFQSKMDVFTPKMLNYAKCVISSIALIIILPLCGIEFFPIAETTPYLMLMLSGVVGIAIGDCFFFTALKELGARKTLLIETLAPPMTGLIAYVYYGTTISLLGWVGVVLTLYGLYIVVVEKEAGEEHPAESEALLAQQQGITLTDLSPLPTTTQTIPSTKQQIQENTSEFSQSKEQAKQLTPMQSFLREICSKGLLCGAAAMFCQSLGMVLSSSVMSTGEFDSLWATLVRVFASCFALYPIVKQDSNERMEWPRFSLSDNISMTITILISTIFCIWMSNLSLVYSRPEISQTLMATSPLFGLLIGRMKGEQVSMKQIIGSFISVLGVALIVQD